MKNRLTTSEAGASIVEYLITLGVLVISISAAMSVFSARVSERLEVAANHIAPVSFEYEITGGGTDQLYEICYPTVESMPQDGHQYRICPSEEESSQERDDDGEAVTASGLIRPR